ncbi:DUF2752 domain-containing protein [bacterium]|nr:DUF2752 domain-containing protein [bacterium]
MGFFVAPSDVEGGFILCWFKRLTGIDCPGCGLTRAFLSIPRGHLWRAFLYNWASPFLYLAFFMYWLSSLMELLRGKQISYPGRFVYALSTLIMVLLVGGWVYKLLIHFHVLG